MGEVEQKFKWDMRFLDMAKLVSSWSKDPSTKVGAVITTKDNRVVSVGYNGFPTNVNDDKEKMEDREYKLAVTIHAETNAINFAKRDLTGCTIYTYPFMPCSNCASNIIQSGIDRVVTLTSDVERWKKSFDISLDLFRQAGVKITYYNM
jgi:dCMP deaminase